MKGQWERELIKNNKKNCADISVNTFTHIEVMKLFSSGEQIKLLSCLSENSINISKPYLG